MSVSAEQLHSQLLDRVARLRTSEEWLQAMVAAARFHDYSLGNWLLLWSQAEQRGSRVTRPAGYRAWQKLGRQVRKGETGYRILAPVTRRVTSEEDETEERMVVGFRVVTVFDVSQTDGEPLPDIGPRLLTGDGNATLADVGISMIVDAGYTFSLGELRGPNGVTRPATQQVVVDGSLDGAQITKTTIHELAHVLMHADAGLVDCRGQVEVEAESVAYVVCAAAGLDSSKYSVAYVARWAETTDDPDRTLLQTGERIVAVARQILDHLERYKALSSRSNQTDAHPSIMSLNSDMMVMSEYEPREMERKERR